jgi:hypothetical protein
VAAQRGLSAKAGLHAQGGGRGRQESPDGRGDDALFYAAGAPSDHDAVHNRLNRIRFLKFELDFLTHWENSASLVSYHLRMDLLFSSLEGTLNPSNDVRRAAEAKLGEVGMARVYDCELKALDSIAIRAPCSYQQFQDTSEHY